MPCRQVGNAIVCTRGRSGAPCSVPGCGAPHVALCDFPVARAGRAGTCDAKLCERHRVRQPGKDRDFCPPHAKAESPFCRCHSYPKEMCPS